MPLLPLWSGIVLNRVNTKDDTTTGCNANVENWFRIVKHSILNSESSIKAAEFTRSIC